MRLVRNLTPGEIVGQVMLARDALGEWPKGAGTMAGLDEDPEDDPEGAQAYRRRTPAHQHRHDGHG
jgi:23S rRNA (adenine2503-C2)-methyltransferase